MAKVFSSYTNVVRKMVRNYNVELYNYFSEQNIEESWVDHDNWNGGIDFYMIIIRVPVDYFENIRRRGVVEEIENTIGSFYNDAMRGDGESIQLRGVILKPIADDISVFGDNVDDSMWKPGHFRLFISHLSANKESASNLKRCLLDYGIDCFVAHEDITPSKEWEMEIEKALFTMDALCAIVVPDFIKNLLLLQYNSSNFNIAVFNLFLSSKNISSSLFFFLYNSSNSIFIFSFSSFFSEIKLAILIKLSLIEDSCLIFSFTIFL